MRCAHCPLKAQVCEIEQHLMVKKGSYKQNVNVVVTSNKPPSRSKLASLSQVIQVLFASGGKTKHFSLLVILFN